MSAHDHQIQKIINASNMKNASDTSVHGLHHVTVIGGDPQENLDFYTRVMGMRFVKKSINQDSPDTYHLFYADGAGSPGTDLTFFPWPDLPRSRPGTGQIVEVPFAVPVGSLDYWLVRFDEHDVAYDDIESRFGEKTLPFIDPHGLRLALVETDDARDFVPWDESPVPSEHQLRGMHAVRIWQRSLDSTERVLTELMGFEKLAEESDWHRYGVDGGGSGTYADIRVIPEGRRGSGGMGDIHHAAWRVRDKDEELAVREVIDKAGLRPTPPIDRFWFESVYFREPGGVLFELATDGPGFSRDEDPDHLGEKLVLPPWLEDRRSEIEAGLPALDASHAAS